MSLNLSTFSILIQQTLPGKLGMMSAIWFRSSADTEHARPILDAMCAAADLNIGLMAVADIRGLHILAPKWVRAIYPESSDAFDVRVGICTTHLTSTQPTYFITPETVIPAVQWVKDPPTSSPKKKSSKNVRSLPVNLPNAPQPNKDAPPPPATPPQYITRPSGLTDMSPLGVYLPPSDGDPSIATKASSKRKRKSDDEDDGTAGASII